MSIFDPQQQHEDVDSKITAALERLSQVFRVLLWEQTKQHQLSPIQVQLLVYLKYHQELKNRVNDLAKQFSLTPATVSDALRTLEKKGLVARLPDEADRRAIRIGLTAEGENLAGQLGNWAEVLRQTLTGFPEGEKVAVMKFLMRLIEKLQQAGLIPLPRMCFTCRYLQIIDVPPGTHPYFCQLMNKPLYDATLRLDCPDHEQVA